MLRTRPNVRRRKANILIVTLLLLALFATIGLTIVYYTKDLSEQQRVNIEAQSNGALTFVDDGSMAVNEFLNNLIYGQPTSALAPGNTNTIIGHDLMRTMYGGGVNGTGGTTTAWDGVGTFHEQYSGVDRALLVNLAPFNGAIVPEYTATTLPGTYVPKNAGYTYPDLKDFYLAAFVPATGEVVTPSFYRPTSFRPAGAAAGTTGLEPPGSANANPNWTLTNNTAYRAMIARPRPVDNSPAFPYPPPNPDGTYTGDVQNLSGSYHFNPKTGQFYAYNDSIWIDIGLPPMTLLNGKTIKPLVAPLVIDLDSLINYSIHGTSWAQVQGNNVTGGSGAGLGPWEINLVRAFKTDGPTLINKVNNSSSSQPNYDTRVTYQLPTYAAVPWKGNTGSGAGAASGSLSLPGQSAGSYYSTSPTYSGTYDSTNSVSNPYAGASVSSPTFSDLQALLAQYAGPPSIYNGISSSSPLSGLSTIQGQTSQWTQVGSGLYSPSLPYPTTLPANSTNQPYNVNGYRLDPAHANRGILTNYSWSLDVPGLSPNFLNASGMNGLSLVPGTPMTGGILTNPTAGNSFPSPGGGVPKGAISDFVNKQWYNNRALGPIDLNRPLADYRSNTSQPLSPTNMATANVTLGTQTVTQAAYDRQIFAMAIFVRLVVASGADASYQVLPTVGETISFPNLGGAPATPQSLGVNQFNALRSLAQLAANIVDYIDSDDVSTAFVWNPANPADPLNPINFGSIVAMENAVVFGVEKPRLVLNEAYAEITNNPNEPALNNPQNPLQRAGNAGPNSLPYIRYWLELTNPSTTSNFNTPIGTGGVTLYYPQGQAATPYAPYIVQVVRSDPNAGVKGPVENISDLLRNPGNVGNAGNVLGTPARANVAGTLIPVPADLTYVFNTSTTVNPSGTVVLAPAPTFAQIQQNKNQAPDWNPPGGNWTFGAAQVITAQPPPPGNSANATNTLTYVSPNLTLAAAVSNKTGTVQDGFTQNIVMLRRLANPYLQPNDPSGNVPGVTFQRNLPLNPYITVDYMDYVPATDRVLMLNNQPTKRTAGTESLTQYPSQPASLGKVQPYSSWTAANQAAPNATTGTYSFSFPSSLVVPQKPTQQTTTVQHTFGYANTITAGTAAYPPQVATYLPSTITNGPAQLSSTGKPGGQPETIMTPYDWFPQMDRTLLNQIELLQVSTGKPHEYTLRAITPNAAGNDVTKFGTQTTGFINASSTNMLYRALDVLRIQPYFSAVPLGGRVPGKLNINTIQDKRVFDSLVDPQSWNTFSAQSDVLNMWNQLIGTRTPSVMQAANQRYTPSGTALTDTFGSSYYTPVPGQSVYDTPAGTGDRPFLTFGAPTFAAPPKPATGFAFNGGSGLTTDTLARNGSLLGLVTPFSNTGVGNGAPPYIVSSTTNSLVPHPYVQVEALRKLMNNTTTVSHTFAVWVTVGYFDYNITVPAGFNNPNALPTGILGAEYYNFVPGDLRRKYFAIVDRSMAGMDLTNYKAGNKTVQAASPSMTPILGTSPIMAGSNTVTTNSYPGWSVGTSYVLGIGATQEIITLSNNQPTTKNGVTTYTLAPKTSTQYSHYPGEPILNYIPGNPGPQPNFNYTGGQYNNSVVQYVARLQ